MTERRRRCVSTLRLVACALAAGLACGFAGAAVASPAYTPPGTGGAPPPRPPAKRPPVIARVIATSIQGDELIITIAAGSNSGVGPDWTAQLLRGESEDLLSGVEITIVRVDKTLTVAKIKASPEQLRWYSRVKLSPP